jgi:uncharacterized membrane protein YedE/YeeE
MKSLFKFLLFGFLFGVILIQSEVVSWFRIQEMFRFQSFHMYGIIGSAIVVGAISLQIIKRFNIKDLDGNPISVAPKDPTQISRYIIGGTLFGLGWGLTGACPAPLFSVAGAGYLIFIVPILSAVAGTWVYGKFQQSLPH